MRAMRNVPPHLALALLPGLLLALAPACSSPPAAEDPPRGDQGPTNALVAARPYEHQVPAGYDPKQPAPLLLLLHGYSANALVQDALFGLKRFTDENNILYAFPDGTKDKRGNQFWNATDECCNRDNLPVDDVAYLTAVIDDMSARYNVDKKRIFITGHSNGGFMAYRLACDLSPRIAGIVSLAGAMWQDMSKCRPSEPVAVAQVHGTLDDAVPYAAARPSVEFWARQDGCGPSPDPAQSPPQQDLDRAVAGAETQIERFPGCKGGAAELWTLSGSGHVPILQQPGWAKALWSFLSAHPKP